MKIGLFFGSFNPIHIGHLIIANAVYNHTDCREIWFIVSPQNPFKKSNTLAHEFDRYDMVKAAIDDNYHFKVSDVEFNMPKPSYTVDTLAYLREKHPDKELRLIIGSDNLKGFEKWKNHDVILKDFGLIIYPRPNQIEIKYADQENVEVVEAPLLDISASYIRKQISSNKSIDYLLPQPVIGIMKNRKLYGY